MIFSSSYGKKTDATLIDRVHKGDKKAFKEILIRYQAGVYGFALSFLRDPHESEDISQEVFLRLYRNAPTCGPAGLRSYLFKITRNLCIDHLRKKRPETMYAPPGQPCFKTPYSELCASQLGNKINEIISTLPENQRAAIHLRHVHEMTYREISEALGVTVQAVESLLTRARRTFRNRFESIKEYQK